MSTFVRIFVWQNELHELNNITKFEYFNDSK